MRRAPKDIQKDLKAKEGQNIVAIWVMVIIARNHTEGPDDF